MSPSVTAQATAKPITQPRKAEAKLMRIEIQNDARIAGVKRPRMFWSVMRMRRQPAREKVSPGIVSEGHIEGIAAIHFAMTF